jgi:hypothetical protein
VPRWAGHMRAVGATALRGGTTASAQHRWRLWPSQGEPQVAEVRASRDPPPIEPPPPIGYLPLFFSGRRGRAEDGRELGPIPSGASRWPRQRVTRPSRYQHGPTRTHDQAEHSLQLAGHGAHGTATASTRQRCCGKAKGWQRRGAEGVTRAGDGDCTIF